VYIPLLQSLTSAAQTASTLATTSASTNPGQDLTSTFLTLLAAQLKSQSPINPLDPNQFVAQLTQFSSLGELTQIQQLLQTLVNNTTPTSSPNSNANANSISTPSPNSSRWSNRHCLRTFSSVPSFTKSNSKLYPASGTGLVFSGGW
jgi:hypothetical protein